MKRLITLTIGMVLLGASTGTASAATVWTDPAFPKRVYFQADPGEANHLLAWKADGRLMIGDAYAFTLTDPFADSSPCTLAQPDTPNRLDCGAHTTLVAALGDDDDTLAYRTFDPRYRVSADGGDGTDVLRGGAGRDHLVAEVASGAPGNDILVASVLAHGGLGRDTCVRASGLTMISCERLA